MQRNMPTGHLTDVPPTVMEGVDGGNVIPITSQMPDPKAPEHQPVLTSTVKREDPEDVRRDEKHSQFAISDKPLLEGMHFDKDLKSNLSRIASSQNLAEYMTPAVRLGLGTWCVDWMAQDEETRTKWLKSAKAAEDLVMNLGDDGLKSPTPDSGDEDELKVAAHPLLAHAILSFAAKTTPTLMADGMPVKAYMPGSDVLDSAAMQTSDKIAKALSHQCVSADAYWERGLDTIVHLAGAEGMAYRRRTYDPLEEEFRTEVLSARSVVVSDKIQRLEDAPRISYRYEMPLFQVRQYQNRGYFHEVPYNAIDSQQDPQAMVTLVEQVTRLPLVTGSTLDIPVAITLEETSQQVIRITPLFDINDVRIFPSDIDGAEYAIVTALPVYTDYHFLPSLFGGFHSYGYGLLLSGMNKSMNLILQEIIRSAQNYSRDGGVISSRVGLGEDIRTRPGYLQVVEADVADLKQQMMMFNTKPPSTALFQVMGLLQEAGRQLASTVNFAEMSASVSATQIAAMTSQGEQVASSIFRRLRADMGREFRALLTLNRVYRTKPYSFEFSGEVGFVDATVFMLPVSVVPTADPKMGSDAKKYAKLQMLTSMLQDPFTDPITLRQLMWPLMDVADPQIVKKLIKQPQPDPQLEMEKQRLNSDLKKAAAETQEKLVKSAHVQAQIKKIIADIQVAAQHAGNDTERVRLQDMKTQLDTILKSAEIELGHKQLAQTKDVSAAKTNGRLSD